MGHIELSSPVAHVWYTRRVPSYLGLLLDISRRNLDRVLYFAQYIVTYVDEDARQKALARLDEEYKEKDSVSSESLNAQIEELQADRDLQIESLKQKEDEITSFYNETIASQLEPVIKSGQRLESDLQGRMGKTIRKDIVFPGIDLVIAK